MKNILIIALVNFSLLLGLSLKAQTQIVVSGLNGPTVWSSANLATPGAYPGSIISDYTGEPLGWNTNPTPFLNPVVNQVLPAWAPQGMWVNENQGQVHGALFKTTFIPTNSVGSYYINVLPDNQCQVYINGIQIGTTFNWNNQAVVTTMCIPDGILQLNSPNLVAIKATEFQNNQTMVGFDIWYDPTMPVINGGSQAFCITDAPAQLTGIPAGGVWSGPGVDPSGLFTPSNANIGTNQISYTVNVGGGNCPRSITSLIIVNDVPTPATISPGNQSYFVTDGPIQYTGTPGGGTWSGTGIDANGLFTPSNTPIGTHTLSYTVNTGMGQCPQTVSVEAEVQDIQVSISPGDQAYCTDAGQILYLGTPSGGIWSGPGVSFVGIFNPQFANIGNNVLTYTLTIGIHQYIKSVNAVVEDCCSQKIGNEITYQKALLNGNIENVKTISTVISNGKIYSVHQNIDFIPPTNNPPPAPNERYNEMIITVQDVYTGSIISSWKYDFSKDEQKSYVFSKEIQVVEEGNETNIYVLANTSPSSSDGDNSSYSANISGILMKINSLSGNIAWIKNKEIPFSGVTIDGIADNVFFNSFSPYYDKDKFEGFIMVGSARLKVNNHYRMLPALVRTDANGDDIVSKLLEFDIPCPTCNNNDNRVESNWAVDISSQVDHFLYKYAVLLESRDNFNGIVGHNPSNIRMTYVFLDENLNVNPNYIGPVKWWSSSSEINDPINPRKIRYDIDGGNRSIKIVGQYTDNTKGFFAQFDNSMSLYNYNSSKSKEILETSGLVDIAFNNVNYYLLGNNRLFEFDQSLNYIKSSSEFDTPLFTASDFHVFNNYIGNLVNIVPTVWSIDPLVANQSGFIINDVNSQTYRKMTDNMDMPCGYEFAPPLFNNLNLNVINSEYAQYIPEMNYPDLQPNQEPIFFQQNCCLENVIRSSEQSSHDELNGQNIVKDDLIFTVYPNPSNDFIQIANSVELEKYDQVSIFNLNGKLVYHDTNVSANSRIKIDKLNSSIYILEIISGDKVSKQRLSISK